MRDIITAICARAAAAAPPPRPSSPTSQTTPLPVVSGPATRSCCAPVLHACLFFGHRPGHKFGLRYAPPLGRYAQQRCSEAANWLMLHAQHNFALCSSLLLTSSESRCTLSTCKHVANAVLSAPCHLPDAKSLRKMALASPALRYVATLEALPAEAILPSSLLHADVAKLYLFVVMAHLDLSPTDGDLLAVPDPSTLTPLPWKPEV
eukprot:6181484-Pleurochrysis_carterae.AAC.6